MISSNIIKCSVSRLRKYQSSFEIKSGQSYSVARKSSAKIKLSKSTLSFCVCVCVCVCVCAHEVKRLEGRSRRNQPGHGTHAGDDLVTEVFVENNTDHIAVAGKRCTKEK